MAALLKDALNFKGLYTVLSSSEILLKRVTVKKCMCFYLTLKINAVLMLSR